MKPRAKCGTYGGYGSHYYHHEPVCDPCKAAAAKYHAGRYRANQLARPELRMVPRIYWDPAAA